MNKNQERLTTIKSFIQGLITSEMSVDQLNNINAQVKVLDEAIEEDKKTNDELVQAKDTIINIVKTSGSGTPPKEPSDESKSPRSLEEIAKSIVNGGK